MAIWQFTFNLVSQANSKINNDEIIFNKNYNLNQDSINILSKNFPLSKSWTKELFIYGNIDETCLEVYYNNSIIDEITVKIDLRNITEKMILNILSFAKSNNLDIYYNNNFFLATIENLKKLIFKSNEYKFIKNPTLFFN